MGSTGGLVDGGRKSGACVGSIRGVVLVWSPALF